MAKKIIHKVSRRDFIAATSTALAAPLLAPSSALGLGNAIAPSERITLGTIGVGGMGRGNTREFARNADCQVVAVCDVDKNNLKRAAGEINKIQKNEDCATYKDYRELIGHKDIDAICIATPDHWHALACVEAANKKKDIYCQKPITHTFREGQAVVEAVRKNKVIFQTGSQQRSNRRQFRKACEIVRNGVLGKIKKVEVGLPTGHQKPHGDPKIQDPPAHVDYDFWCGPSKKLPFRPARFHFHWRWNLNYGGGQLMDWIGHHNDIAHWGLDFDKSGPKTIKATGFDYAKGENREIYDSAWKYEVICEYEGGIDWRISNRFRRGAKFIGENGWVFVSRGAFEASDKNWTKGDFNPGDIKLYNSPEHHKNFLASVKSRKECICPAETGHRSITPGHLGMVSEALGGRVLKWDPKKETIIGDPEADRLLKAVNYRGPWVL